MIRHATAMSPRCATEENDELANLVSMALSPFRVSPNKMSFLLLHDLIKYRLVCVNVQKDVDKLLKKEGNYE